MITETQREKRKNNVGGSDIAAILGICPFSSAEDVRLEKCRDLEPLKPSDAMEMGNYMEAPIIDWLEKRIGRIKRGGERRVPDTKLLIHLDGSLATVGDPVEAKLSQYEGERWGSNGTDDVPDRVNVQVHGAMLATKSERGYVGAATIRNGRMTFSWYIIPFNKDLADLILEKVDAFWTKHVIADTPCVSSRANLETLTRIRREASKSTTCSPHVIDFWNNARLARLAAEKVESMAKAAMLAAMDNAELLEDGEKFVTFFEQRGSPKIDRDAMRVDEIFDKYATEATFRRLVGPKKMEKVDD